jgi:hypothetical protein
MTLDLDGTPRVLQSFKALGKVPLASGQGLGLSSGAMTALLTFSDRTTSVATVYLDGTAPELVALKGGEASGYDPGVTYSTLLGQGQNTLGHAVFQAGVKGAPSSSDMAVYAVTGSGGGTLGRVTTKGADAPGIAGATFASFRVSVLNADDTVAFKAKVAGAGTTADDRYGIWIWRGGDGELIVRENDEADGTPSGTRWDDFTEIALPDEGRLVFVGRLAIGSGSPAVTKTDDLGLWAVDTGEITHMVVREGITTVEGKTVKSFKALGAGVGSPGQARNYNGVGGLVYWAQFADGAQGIVNVQIP